MPDFRQQLYERYASTFKEDHGLDDQASLEGYWSWARHRLLPLLGGLPRGARVLEIGCGTGPLLQLLRKEGWSRIEGVDVAPEMVARAQARGLEVRQGDVFAFLEGSDDRYDAIVALDFVEHFTKEELLRLLPMIHERLAPGGTLLLQTPNGEGLLPNRVVYGDLTHITVFTPQSLQQLLKVTGFEDFTFTETGPVPTTVTRAVRAALWSAIRFGAMAVKLVETGHRQRLWTENMLCRCRRG
jgi:2-polyprenyl-3-methyl-5-hydroxy-6-metoxy-1,4-benzoquinol methylase